MVTSPPFPTTLLRISRGPATSPSGDPHLQHGAGGAAATRLHRVRQGIGGGQPEGVLRTAAVGGGGGADRDVMAVMCRVGKNV